MNLIKTYQQNQIIPENEAKKQRLSLGYILKITDKGLHATDLNINYLIRSDYDQTPGSTWMHNSNYLIEYLRPFNPKTDWPFPFDIEKAKQIRQLLCGSNMRKTRKKIFSSYSLKGRYTGSHNRYTGGLQVAFSQEHLLAESLFEWQDLSKIKIESDIDIVYNNGASYITKPFQLWSDGSGSMFRTSSDQKVGNLDKNIETLILYAIDDRKSDWIKQRTWRELLNLNPEDVEISEFQEIMSEETASFCGRSAKVAEYTTTKDGQFLLIRLIHATMFEDGDVQTYYYLARVNGRDVTEYIKQKFLMENKP